LQKGRDRIPGSLMNFSETLGNLYLKTARYDQAVNLFKKTSESFTGLRRALAYNNMGVSYLYMWNDLQARRAQFAPEQYAGKTEEVLKPAAEAFLKGLELNNDMPFALDSYVNVSCYRGKGSEIEAKALEQLKQKEDFNN